MFFNPSIYVRATKTLSSNDKMVYFEMQLCNRNGNPAEFRVAKQQGPRIDISLHPSRSRGGSMKICHSEIRDHRARILGSHERGLGGGDGLMR